MPIKTEDFNQDLYDLLKVREYDPTPIDSKGETVAVPQEADVFRFTFKQDGKEYGDAWVTIEKGKNLVLYYDDKIEDVDADDPDTLISDSFTDLKKHLKYWARRRQLGFELKNRNHLRGDMAQRHHMKQKEQLGEGYYPMGKKASYNDSVPQVKIILQHTRQIEEGEQRFRNIEKIFVENVNGERFLLPTIRPGIARVYGRHIAEGGTPYDDKGKHITSLVEEYTKMAGFVRATRNGQFNESAQRLVTEAVNHYGNLRETLQGMASHRGYNKYFDNWSPVLNEETGDDISLNELFVQETLDPRIESVMPILKKLNKNITENSLIAELDNWAEGVIKEKLEEAPGAETLAHNQGTEQQRLKDLDLEENKKEKSDQTKKLRHLKRQYRDNENENNHTENALLLTTHFGTDDEVRGVRAAMAHRDKHGGYSSGDKEAKRHMDHVHQMHKKYSPKILEDESLEEASIKYHVLYVDGKPKVKFKTLASAQKELEEMKKHPDFKDKKIEIKVSDEHQAIKEENLDEEVKVKYEVVDKDGKHLGTWDGIEFKPYDRTKYAAGKMDKIPAGSRVDKESGPLDSAHMGMSKIGMEEDLDANQKRAKQLGPTTPVGKNEKNLQGIAVGASESAESTEEAITEMDSPGPHDDPWAKGGKATPIKADKAKKDFAKMFQKNIDKANKTKQDTDKKVTQHMKEGQDDLDAILRIVRK